MLGRYSFTQEQNLLKNENTTDQLTLMSPHNGKALGWVIEKLLPKDSGGSKKYIQTILISCPICVYVCVWVVERKFAITTEAW